MYYDVASSMLHATDDSAAVFDDIPSPALPQKCFRQIAKLQPSVPEKSSNQSRSAISRYSRERQPIKGGKL
jgi:hypothetical protein